MPPCGRLLLLVAQPPRLRKSQIKILLYSVLHMTFDPIRFTRELVDIESTTGNEGECGELLMRELTVLGFKAIKVPVAVGRFNVLATSPQEPFPEVFFSTHFDCVPP